jgi:adenylate cyclase
VHALRGALGFTREPVLEGDLELFESFKGDVHLVDTDAPSGRGAVDATIAFVDVASFTKLAEAEGDEAAIGDALMLAFRDSGDAVDSAAELEHTVRADDSLPGLRVGMHCAPAIYRGGDHLGTTVNVAARVAAQASAGETLVTDTVADRVADGLLENVGVRMLRGVEKPLALYRLQHEGARHDPVCGAIMESPNQRR